MSMPSLEPEETPLAPDELASPRSSSTTRSAGGIGSATGETAAAAIEVPRTVIEPAGDGWALIALVPYDGQEPPAAVSDELARAVWCAVSALWHPSLLARAAGLPRIESVDSPSPPGSREIRVIASGAGDRLPSGYKTQAEDARSALLESGTDRADLIRQIQTRLGADGALETVENEGMTTTARDFLALGTIAVAASRPDRRDGARRCARPRKPDARAAGRGPRLADRRLGQRGQSAPRRLRGADPGPRAVLPRRCLSDRSVPARPGDARGRARRPAGESGRHLVHRPGAGDREPGPARPAAAWPRFGRRSATAGPTWRAALIPRPKTRSCRWSRSSGSSGGAIEVYRAHLDDRNVETYARRRFGLYTQLPQIAKRFGFRFALHMGFDAGRFPIRPETKRLWESPDGSNLESSAAPADGGRPAVAGVVGPVADGGDDEGRPRGGAPAGPLAQAGRPVVSRPAPGRRLFAGPGAMDDAQRLFPSDRPPLRDDSPGARHLPDRPTWRRRSRGASASRSGGWPVTIGCGRGWRRRGRSRRWRGRSRRPRPAP